MAEAMKLSKANSYVFGRFDSVRDTISSWRLTPEALPRMPEHSSTHPVVYLVRLLILCLSLEIQLYLRVFLCTRIVIVEWPHDAPTAHSAIAQAYTEDAHDVQLFSRLMYLV